jgi:hypothetical protein
MGMEESVALRAMPMSQKRDMGHPNCAAAGDAHFQKRDMGHPNCAGVGVGVVVWRRALVERYLRECGWGEGGGSAGVVGFGVDAEDGADTVWAGDAGAGSGGESFLGVADRA